MKETKDKTKTRPSHHPQGGDLRYCGRDCQGLCLQRLIPRTLQRGSSRGPRKGIVRLT